MTKPAQRGRGAGRASSSWRGRLRRGTQTTAGARRGGVPDGAKERVPVPVGGGRGARVKGLSALKARPSSTVGSGTL